MKRSAFITWDQLKVGGVIIAAMLVLGVAIYKLGQAANLFAKRYELVTYLPTANGLRTGGTVFVAGQFAGTIKAIEFLPIDNDTPCSATGKRSRTLMRLCSGRPPATR